MRRKVVAGMLTFAMFGMSLSSFSPTQVCAADDLGKVEVHVSAKKEDMIRHFLICSLRKQIQHRAADM